MSIVAGKSVTIAQARLEGAVVQTIKDWAMAFPHELVWFDQQMKRERRELHRTSAISDDGNMRKFGDIPAKLYALMNARFGPLWQRDAQTMRLFWRNFEVGKINRWSDLGRRM